MTATGVGTPYCCMVWDVGSWRSVGVPVVQGGLPPPAMLMACSEQLRCEKGAVPDHWGVGISGASNLHRNPNP